MTKTFSKQSFAFLAPLATFLWLTSPLPAATFSDANWVTMGGVPGVNGWVNTMVMSAVGDLYVGGSFRAAGSVLASSVAKWDGTNWSALGSGVNRQVRSLAVLGSDLYTGGLFASAGGVAANAIAKWDGSNWSPLGSGTGGYYPDDPHVYALALSGGELYAGGSFTNAGGIAADFIAKWDGSKWSALGSGVACYMAGYEPRVSALAVSDSELYVGGNFTIAGGRVSAYVANAVINPGNWLQLQFGVPGPNTNTLTYVGVPEAQYLIQFATNLTSSPWFTLATNTAPVNGRGMVQDPTATDSQRFYRLREP